MVEHPFGGSRIDCESLSKIASVSAIASFSLLSLERLRPQRTP